MREVKITDSKQIAYLNFKGVNFKRFIREGNKKVFIYEDGDLVDTLVSEFYNSEISKYLGCYENIKTLIFRT
ncbi:MAG TPA: DUF5659 domain-containing protein [Clostridium sp.]|uniref:DUF5659 domain-containing protein n=1 Tax=Clostridium sp. TaxID=1506 RepID=UPI002F959458